MIFYKDKEYILEADLQQAQETAKNIDLKKGLTQLKKEYDEYKKEHKDVQFKEYIIDLYNNKINYEDNATTTNNDANYTQSSTTNNQVSVEVEQSADKVINNAASVYTTLTQNA